MSQDRQDGPTADQAPSKAVVDAPVLDPDLMAGLLAPQGWAYASMTSVEAGDPGRFHALFGRDSLIFALQVLPHRPDIARATLLALAELQGSVVDPEIDEEPGKIVHEYRPVAPDWLVADGWPLRDGGIRYYGTSDATSWFLVVLASLADAELTTALTGAWQAAAGWLEAALDAGGGLVRCGPRLHPGGLSQQGWRDSDDPAGHPEGGGIVRQDGSAPSAPLADADSQAVAAAGLQALTLLDPARAQHWRDRLAQLRVRISRSFTPDVLALDATDDVVPGAGSQLGWLLWANALDPPARGAVADRLVEPDVLTRYGLRTLSSGHRAFAPAAYHRGAVWPFDSWLGWGGLRSVGRGAAAEQVRVGVLSALEQLGRAPELYAVTTQGRLQPIPIANRMQAWTVGAQAALRSEWDGRAIFD